MTQEAIKTLLEIANGNNGGWLLGRPSPVVARKAFLNTDLDFTSTEGSSVLCSGIDCGLESEVYNEKTSHCIHNDSVRFYRLSSTSMTSPTNIQ